MQTEGQKQFRINRQVCIVLVTMLTALALPLGGVIVMLQGLAQSRKSQEAAPTASEALQSRLEGIVDEKLSPGKVPATEPRIELVADDLGGEKARIDRLLAFCGGTSIPRFESETEIRLLIQAPPERLKDFLLEYRGKEAGLVGDLSGGFLEVVIKKSGSR